MSGSTTPWKTWSANGQGYGALGGNAPRHCGHEPVRYLAQIGQIDVLADLFEKMMLPSVVEEENAGNLRLSRIYLTEKASSTLPGIPPLNP